MPRAAGLAIAPGSVGHEVGVAAQGNRTRAVIVERHVAAETFAALGGGRRALAVPAPAKAAGGQVHVAADIDRTIADPHRDAAAIARAAERVAVEHVAAIAIGARGQAVVDGDRAAGIGRNVDGAAMAVDCGRVRVSVSPLPDCVETEAAGRDRSPVRGHVYRPRISIAAVALGGPGIACIEIALARNVDGPAAIRVEGRFTAIPAPRDQGSASADGQCVVAIGGHDHRPVLGFEKNAVVEGQRTVERLRVDVAVRESPDEGSEMPAGDVDCGTALRIEALQPGACLIVPRGPPGSQPNLAVFDIGGRGVVADVSPEQHRQRLVFRHRGHVDVMIVARGLVWRSASRAGVDNSVRIVGADVDLDVEQPLIRTSSSSDHRRCKRPIR